ncbi:MAG: hypothetical protein U1E17_22865 [Geminicoccaceae bacterium]
MARPRTGRFLGAAALALCFGATLGSWAALAQQGADTRAIVEDALKGVAAQQAKDAERVRRMSEEAARGVQEAPSGKESVNPTAPATLRPLADGQAAVLPAGYDAGMLKDRPVRNAAGEQIGTLRGPAVDEATGQPKVMVEFAPLFGQPGKLTALSIEQLSQASGQGDGYVVELTPVAYGQLGEYRLADGAWRRGST